MRKDFGIKKGLRGVKNKIVTMLNQGTIKKFHKTYYGSEVFARTFWQGTQTLKCPLDLWIFQEIIYETKPDIIIECGTYKGGSALFLANMLDLIRKGEVITIDVEEKESPKHNRITYLKGSSVSDSIVEKIKKRTKNKKSVMAILDSDHRKKHVLKELEIYSKLVTKGNYIIVEDTNVNSHPVRPDFGHGPMEAVNEFLKNNKNFSIDKEREKFLLTFNPGGFIKRII